MSAITRLRGSLVGVLGRKLLWLWTKSCRMIVIGEESYRRLRSLNRPVVLIMWHGRIFLVPYFFRHRRIMPLISPSGDGEIVARIMSGWGYKILRGSGSHTMVKAWNAMLEELQRGGEVIIVPDGPRGPDRELKTGCLKLAQQTGAQLVPFSFSTTKKKFLKSWDRFLMFYPLRKVVAVFGEPISIPADLSESDLERTRLQVEAILRNLDVRADRYFGETGENQPPADEASSSQV